ncbi:rCG63243 [Rattus norvegicus]|uniref:RCG63243 n=1 Tax=Rattus norvegicus TaxID=10116 RepID=A6JP78_RAT|nr:rCG63243 [Rattus norvegicus]
MSSSGFYKGSLKSYIEAQSAQR